MRYDLDQVPEPIAYKLLAATVIPRPIAWVVTKGAQGVNAGMWGQLAAVAEKHELWC